MWGGDVRDIDWTWGGREVKGEHFNRVLPVREERKQREGWERQG